MIRRSWSRRDFGRLLGVGGALSVLSRLARADRPSDSAPRRATRGPSKLLIIHAAGGIDDMYGINPKHASEVKQGIGPVFRPEELLVHNSLRLAPPYHCLEPYLSRMQVITGIQTRTVSHIQGGVQVAFMRQDVPSDHEPPFVRVAGEVLRQNAPVDAVVLGRNFLAGPTGRILRDEEDGSLLRDLHRIANDEKLRELATGALHDVVGSSANTEVVAKLLQAMKGIPAPPDHMPDSAKIPVDEWPPERRGFSHADGLELEWTKLIFEHDIAPVVCFSPFLNAWDSHSNNAFQQPMNHQLAMNIKYVLDYLSSVKRGTGTLADEVGVVVLSELGRFPFLNHADGKDHLPQISMLLIGPGLVADKFGETDAGGMAVDIARHTGRPGNNGSLIQFDDIGRTLLEWIGHPRPADHGYRGNVLEFCFT